MNAELQAIGMQDLRRMITGMEDANVIIEYARLADPLFAATFLGDLLGFIAFIPRSTLSNSAYVWVHITPAVADHRLVVARLARRWLPIFHARYPNLTGHCFTAPARNWLRTLNARFWPDNLFTIEASHG
jgi:hypothetical protein